MRIKDGYQLCKVGDSSIVLATGNVSMQLSGLTTLNETGEFIWNHLLEETAPDSVVDALTKEYGIDRATAQADFDEFTQKLKGAGFLA
ncbi:MAG: PqqD family protein [Acutalibacteraceae bacterium]